MSARDILLPDQALADILTEIDLNITALERRAQWPGAAHLAQGGAVGPVNAGSYILGGAFVESTLLTLTVDPGRWVFFASVSLGLQRTSGISWPGGGQLHAGITATGSVVRTHPNPRLSVGLTGSRFGAVTDVIDITSTLPVTAVLRAGGNYATNPVPATPPNGQYTISSSILIAFPA